MAGETIYNLLTGTQEVFLDLGPGTYELYNNRRTGKYSSIAFKLVNHTGIKKGDTIWLSAHFSIHGVSDYARAGVEPRIYNYYPLWTKLKEYEGVMVISHTAKKDFPDGTLCDQDRIYFQYDKPVTISEGGYFRIDHVMMNVGDTPAAWAPAEGEALSVGGGQG